jgi:dolichol-phosphate mannosyltransferase
MDGRARELSLIVPACNEAAGVREAIAEADLALAQLAEDYEILVVDDGSRDDTAAIVLDEAVRRPRVRLLRHTTNRGYGAALRTGFEAARFDRVAFTDADCQFHLADLAPLLRLAEEYPLAVGYRVERQDPWPRRFVSWGFNTLARALLGTRVRDCDCALKVFRRDSLLRLLPKTNGFFVNTEMLTRARQLGLDVAEAPVRHRPRLRGRSTVSLTQVPRVLATLLPFWWSQVLFRDSRSSPPLSSRAEERGGRRFADWVCPLLVLFVAGALFLSRLECPLLEPQEARYAEIPRQMLEQEGPAAWLTPILHGQPYYDKPPLLYWLVMLGYSVFGVHDWAARLVPGLAGCLTVLATFLWGRRVAGERAALAGALVLCLSARFVYLGRMLAFDVLLCLFTVLALGAAHVALTAGRQRDLHRGWWLLSALACGLGLLTKGPLALALVSVPVLMFAFLDERAARPLWRDVVLYLGTALGVAAPWFAITAWQHPEFIDHFFWQHNVVRYVAPFDHAEPFWFYLPGLLLGMLPWSLLLPGLGRFLFRHSRRVATRRSPALGFFLLAGLWGLLFFSLAGCKRAVYVLPVMPPLALALGCYLDALLPRRRPQGAPAWSAFLRGRSGFLAHRATLLVLGLGAGAGLLGVLVEILPLRHGFLLGMAALAAGGLLWRSRQRLSWAHCATATFALLFVGIQVALPAYNERFALRTCVEACAAGAEVPIACYPRSWDSVAFYLRRPVRVYSAEQKAQFIADLLRSQRTLLFVHAGRDAQELLRDLPPSLEFTLEQRSGPVLAGWVRPRQPDSTAARDRID